MHLASILYMISNSANNVTWVFSSVLRCSHQSRSCTTIILDRAPKQCKDLCNWRRQTIVNKVTRNSHIYLFILTLSKTFYALMTKSTKSKINHHVYMIPICSLHIQSNYLLSFSHYLSLTHIHTHCNQFVLSLPSYSSHAYHTHLSYT